MLNRKEQNLMLFNLVKYYNPKLDITALELEGNHVEGSTKLAKAFKEKFPKKNLWVWSGFLFEKLKDKEIFKYIDVLVDGQFKIKLKNPKLKYCGSSNQRVIDVQKSLKKKDLVFYYKNEEEESIKNNIACTAGK